ncbi:hypothetical protein E2C01_013798 [Portunus trituberculatus]|uniref:Uncharacterized protein n=1 Tax=Portunus trituberculatus TaxID=210409 RepID=A0A5B7DHK0_PORTR|nr:hypothetical protein [Portunus trituberculatus]
MEARRPLQTKRINTYTFCTAVSELSVKSRHIEGTRTYSSAQLERLQVKSYLVTLFIRQRHAPVLCGRDVALGKC